jgi:hypothetical protein
VLGEPAVDECRQLVDVLNPEWFGDLDDHDTRIGEHVVGDARTAGQTG